MTVRCMHEVPAASRGGPRRGPLPRKMLVWETDGKHLGRCPTHVARGPRRKLSISERKIFRGTVTRSMAAFPTQGAYPAASGPSRGSLPRKFFLSETDGKHLGRCLPIWEDVPRRKLSALEIKNFRGMGTPSRVASADKMPTRRPRGTLEGVPTLEKFLSWKLKINILDGAPT